MPDLDPKDAYTPPPVWSTEQILPDGFLPMLATPANGPLDSPDYAYEPRWEGLRVLAGLEGPRLVLRTGAGQDAGFWFPEAQNVRAAAQPEWVLLDGELVVMEHGHPAPAALRRRLQVMDSAEAAQEAEQRPATLVLYDILRIGDSWLLDVNWDERREILGRAVNPAPGVALSPFFPIGAQAMEHAQGLHLEALVAKRLKGRYYPGERTRDWLSIKPMEVVEAIICGWLEGRGARGGTIGSLILGRVENGRLQYIGHTGTGLDAATLPYLHKELLRRAQRQSPFREEPSLTGVPHWVRPELVCRVRHQGWTEAGKMRGPTFIGLVADRVSTR
jgi:bifunctional non-homologous end joining protein LigD